MKENLFFTYTRNYVYVYKMRFSLMDVFSFFNSFNLLESPPSLTIFKSYFWSSRIVHSSILIFHHCITVVLDIFLTLDSPSTKLVIHSLFSKYFSHSHLIHASLRVSHASMACLYNLFSFLHQSVFRIHSHILERHLTLEWILRCVGRYLEIHT